MIYNYGNAEWDNCICIKIMMYAFSTYCENNNNGFTCCGNAKQKLVIIYICKRIQIELIKTKMFHLEIMQFSVMPICQF